MKKIIIVIISSILIILTPIAVKALFAYHDEDTVSINITGSSPKTLADTVLLNGTSEKTVDSAIKEIINKSTPSFKSVSYTGLYATIDNEGTSFYLRGKITNNYVSYAGYIWKIVRVNGDGSVRMIYSGTETTSTGKNTVITASRYNSGSNDITYVGYVYGDTSDMIYLDKGGFGTLKDSNNYYYSNSYICSDYSCSLNGDMIYGKITNLYDDVINEYRYTCLSSKENGTCSIIIEYTDSGSNYHGYFGINTENMRDDNNSSVAKKAVDSWYEENILNTEYEKYLSDSYFCTDRDIEDEVFSTYTRQSNYQPSLICNSNDILTVDNGKLTYPVALLNIDEALLAGAGSSTKNKTYYLYNGYWSWLMSPHSYLYNNKGIDTQMYAIGDSGGIESYSTTGFYLGLRPVINIDSSVIVTNGDGTSSSPYELGLNA